MKKKMFIILALFLFLTELAVPKLSLSYEKISKNIQMIPGLIEAEDYYEMEGIQLENCHEGGQNVGWIDTGDWFKFSVNVKESGTYLIEYRVASMNGGGRITLDQNGLSLVFIDVPRTDGWQNWWTISQVVNLNQGTQNLAIYATFGGFNVNWIKFTKFGSSAPGIIDAVSYVNMSGIIVETHSDSVQSIGYISDNDWVEYNVNIEETCDYFVELLVGADYGFGGEFKFQVDGIDKETIVIKPTGGWYNWRVVSDFIPLEKGNHIIRLYCAKSYNNGDNIADTANMRWIKFTKSRLIWLDEFDYVGQPDSRKWSYDIGNGNGGWGNNELQNYTDRLENSRVENGKLIIESRRNWYNGYEYSSARLKTIGKGDWLYGRIEVKAKFPTGIGSWPAIWMMPTYYDYGDWPKSGEIDIVEHVGYAPEKVYHAVHSLLNHGNNPINHEVELTDAETDFHVYAIEWFEDKIEYYIDGRKTFIVYNQYTGWQSWPYDKTFYLILNLAVGGNWGGKYGIDNYSFPWITEIDYVKIYQPEIKKDTTPPNIPIVTDEGEHTQSITTLSASWFTSTPDKESGIFGFQYAIGTSKGAIDTLGWTPRDTNNCFWTPEGTTASITRTDLNLQNGKTYYFSVKARNKDDHWSEIGYSDGITVKINHPPELNSIGNKTIDEEKLLQFTISATDPDRDTLTYSATGLPTGATFSGQTFTWTPNYEQAGNYPVTFKVTDGKDGWDTEAITITVKDVLTPPSTPSNLTASALSYNQVKLTWADNSNNEDGFKIERRVSGSPTPFVQIAAVDSNATSFIDSGVLANTTYSYRIRAYNKAGDSGYSNIISITTPQAVARIYGGVFTKRGWNNIPLQDATVKAKSGNFIFRVKTNYFGNYNIENLPPGSYIVTASKQGYHPQSVSLAIKPRSNIKFDFYLRKKKR